jgi:hypothetical protein
MIKTKQKNRVYQTTIPLGLPFSEFANQVVWTGALFLLELLFKTI